MIGVASEFQILNFFKQAYSTRPFKYYGFYNSLFGKIITDEHLMLIPIDDRTATRAHGVFDVLYVKKRKIINIEPHLNRLYQSAASVNITPPFSQHKAREVLIQVVEKVVEYHLKTDQQGSKRNTLEQIFGIRMTISSGYGDLGISSLDKQSILYITIFEPYISYEKEKNGVNQFVVIFVKEPKKLVHSKTIDYTESALMANQSKKKGGYQGIKALENGILLEAAMANIAFIFGKQFATPRFETVVEGTTIKKSLKFLEELVKEGVLEKISFRDITIEESKSADEMIILGGDKIVPVLNFNDNKISESRGPITTRLQDWYQKTNQQGYEVSFKSD